MIAVVALPDEALDFQSELLRAARHMTGSSDKAEDLVQETYARALRYIDHFQPGTNLRAWLYTIMRNLHRDSLKRRPKAGADCSLDDVSEAALRPGGDAEHEAMIQVELSAVLLDIENLPTRQRNMARLVLLENLTYQQAADRLGVPVSSVLSGVHRARRNLRRRRG